MKDRHNLWIAALVAAVCAVTLLVTDSAQAATTGKVDRRPCATAPESDRMPVDQGRSALERFIDTKGWYAYRDATFAIKHYRFCDHPKGWLAVAYTASKADGWAYLGSVLIYWCEQSHGDGPMVACDPNVPCIIEAALFRAGRVDSLGAHVIN